MADVVEHNMEEMVSELKLLEKSQIFDAKELEVITRKKREFEMKLQRPKKSKTDLLCYIQYEMDLLKLVKFKRGQLGAAAKKTALDFSIASHINVLFNQAIRRFSFDVKLWISYLQFCRRANFYPSGSRAVDLMLSYHGDKAALFKVAAWFEFENENIEKARKHFLTGIHQHRDSAMLYIESIKLELDYAAKERSKSGAKDDDPVLKGELAKAIYDSAVKRITNVQFVVDVLKVVKQFAFTEEFQNSIYDDLFVRFPKEELTWDSVAQKDVEKKSTPSKEYYSKLSQTYEEAVKIVNTPLMWKIYIDRMLELKDNPKFPNAKRNALTMALCNGNNAGMLTERDYFLWRDHLQDKDEKRLYKIWKCGTEKLPGSVNLWVERLKWHLRIGDEAGGDEIFHRAVTSLKARRKDVYPLWSEMLEFYQCKGEGQKVEQIYEEASKFEGVGIKIKPLYLYWIAAKKGITSARKLYERLATQPPFSLELHSTMIKLEDLQIPSGTKNMRKCHSLAAQQFGDRDTTVWMNYINFERTQGKAKFIPGIYTQATHSLMPGLVDVFISDYSILMSTVENGHSHDSANHLNV